jgi:hypothetical protein
VNALPQKARTFALAAQGAQRYGERPYAFHLDTVADLTAPYGEDAAIAMGRLLCFKMKSGSRFVFQIETTDRFRQNQ